jgi:uncharacterized membrane protein YeaQ/YmgE (transglycosylase-associated protein family)
MEFLFIVLIFGAICGGLAYAVTPNKEKKVLGAVLGVLLGPIGVLVSVFLK